MPIPALTPRECIEQLEVFTVEIRMVAHVLDKCLPDILMQETHDTVSLCQLRAAQIGDRLDRTYENLCEWAQMPRKEAIDPAQITLGLETVK